MEHISNEDPGAGVCTTMKLYEIKEDVPRTIKGNVRVPEDTVRLNYKNATVHGNFSCGGTQILSLEGSPIKVTGYFNCTQTHITSMKGCPKYVGGHIDASNTFIPNLKNIHKYIAKSGHTLYIPNTIESHILGVLNIRDLGRLHVLDQSFANLNEAIEIVNRYLSSSPNPTARDIHRCQEQLIEADLKEFAQT